MNLYINKMKMLITITNNIHTTNIKMKHKGIQNMNREGQKQKQKGRDDGQMDKTDTGRHTDDNMPSLWASN